MATSTANRTKTTPAPTRRGRAPEQLPVPSSYLQENGKFKPGMDGRFRADLIRSVTGELKSDMLHTYSEKEARAHLKQHGWTKFLPKKFQTSAERKETEADPGALAQQPKDDQ